MAVTYKSSTGETINVGSYVVTVEPGLQLTQAIEELARETGLPVQELINQAIELHKYLKEENINE